MPPRLLPYGDDGMLVEVDDLDAVRSLDRALRAALPPGVVDVVPAARTVLVRGDARRRAAWSAAVAARATSGDRGSGTRPDRVVDVPVVYDGEDLEDVARVTGLSVEEVVARHVAGGPKGYRVAFGGFAPGFAYVVGLDPRLHVPRLATPRTRVPAGAVAVAGEFTAVYPAASPGGWRLLGTTTVVMFDAVRGRDAAARLAPGDVVRFVRHRASAVVGAAPPAPLAPDADAGSAVRTRGEVAAGGPAGRSPAVGGGVSVLATGPLVLVEDLGRPGLADVGVPRSGAADPAALRRANRLVGNRADAAGLEVVLGGLVLRVEVTTALAVTGAHAAADLDGVPVPHGAAIRAPAGATLTLAPPRSGLRSWVALRGGVGVPAVLGSRSADVLSGLGPAAVRAGDLLPLGRDVDGFPELPVPDGAAADPAVGGVAGHPGPVVVLPALDGPRLDRLDAPGRARLWSTVWAVSPASNRVAVRLAGEPLTRGVADELASEGLVAGAVQVPHDGRPLLFGADHPVTGGYPVVAVLTTAGRALAAQLQPGQRVRLTRAV
ncbi:urea amidolyase family protein [Cellulomonas wangsupingiae]|uniref:Urea amidolyase family protein n=1 Tax=Cellulomonas wangsupingiae TaxID=2968085 RepID=A0ABY5K1I3_9CELL|nr:urea amidolyase family protein [Cellulomonas wangsupingiae]MCC2335527.1 urea amidolyase family protein [Cellulomonas wangsupingiae]UUI64302.1 urea amidolyase family protein [Cellulomonas wangsupingiae]